MWNLIEKAEDTSGYPVYLRVRVVLAEFLCQILPYMGDRRGAKIEEALLVLRKYDKVSQMLR